MDTFLKKDLLVLHHKPKPAMEETICDTVAPWDTSSESHQAFVLHVQVHTARGNGEAHRLQLWSACHWTAAPVSQLEAGKDLFDTKLSHQHNTEHRYFQLLEHSI